MNIERRNIERCSATLFRMARVKALMSKWEKRDMSKFPDASRNISGQNLTPEAE